MDPEGSLRPTTVVLLVLLVHGVDLSKAFDKMNHHGLFIRLMERKIPTNLLSLLENWFSIGITCVKWGN